MSNTVIAEGLEFPEGPAFDRNGHLFVVEIRGGQVSRIDTDGKLSVFAKTGGGPNGANFAADGDLYVCNNGGFPGPNKEHGRLERIDSQGNVTVILTQIDGIELASPNDLGFDAAGNLYFTDPIWGDGQPGHVCFLSTEGEARRLHTGLAFPNGIAVTPDGEHLIVCETVTHKLHIYDILAPGRVSAPREFADLGEGAGPDGFAFDAEGNILCCGFGSGQISVFSPEGGSPVDRLDFEDRQVTNVCFGGPDNKTLFVTESGKGRVVTRDWHTAGMVLFPDR